MSAKSMQGINVMKALCRTWWGCHPATQLLLYKSTVRPFLDYGSIFYGKCSRSLREKLDRTQYAALRVVMGYMRSTPIHIILVETNELPLEERRLFLAAKFVSKLHRILNDPVLANINSLRYWTYRGNPPPIVESLRILNNVEGIYSSLHLPCFLRELAVHTTSIEYHSLNLSKTSTDNSAAFVSACLEQYPEYKILFTDASKTPNKTGIGVYSSIGVGISKMIPNYFSICSAELLAILEATWVIKSKNLKKCLIVSDSKGALEKITNWKNAGKNDHITLSIRANLIYLYENDFSVRLVWIPSHTNIYGNEQADYLARNSSERSPIVRADVADVWPTFERIVWENGRNAGLRKWVLLLNMWLQDP